MQKNLQKILFSDIDITNMIAILQEGKQIKVCLLLLLFFCNIKSL